MKQVLLSFFFSASILGFANAQTLTINPNPKNITYEGVNLNQFNDLEEHVDVTNNTNDTLHLKWNRITPSSCPSDWTTLVCDNVQCYSESVNSNIDPATNPSLIAPFTLAPSEIYDNFILHVRPGASAGCCQITLEFSTVENPDEIIETLIYDISINDPQCLISSTKEPAELAGVQLYPNPSTGQFSITDNPLVKSIAVHNLLGKPVAQFAHQTGRQHELVNAPDGLYLVNLLDENGQVLKTLRLSKQGLRP